MAIASGAWWTLDDDGTLRIYCDGDMPDYSSGSRTPWYSYNVSHVTISDSVTSVGAYAFSACHWMSSVTIPNSVTAIGVGAFNNCYGLISATIPNSVVSIGDFAFSDCNSLTNITLSDRTTSIGKYAFSNCTSLTGAIIGNGVTTIRCGAFFYCESLTSLSFPICENVEQEIVTGCFALESLTLTAACNIEDNAFVGILDPENKIFTLYLRGNEVGHCSDSVFDIYDFDYCVGEITPIHDVFSDPIPGLEIYVPENLLNNFKTIWAGGAFAQNIFTKKEPVPEDPDLSVFPQEILIGADMTNPVLTLRTGDFPSLGIISTRAADLSGESLVIDDLQVKIRVDDGNGAIPAALENISYKMPVYYIVGGIAQKFFFKNCVRTGKFEYSLSAVSGIGLLDKPTHYGGLYSGETLQSVIDSVMSSGGRRIAPYTVDPVIAQVPVYGWLPIRSARENLLDLIQAFGFIISRDENLDLYFTLPAPIADAKELTPDRVFHGGSVDYKQDRKYAKIEVSEYNFLQTDADQEVVLYDKSRRMTN